MKRLTSRLVIVGLVGGLMLAGCASTKKLNEQVDNQIASEKVGDGSASKARDAIWNHPNLTEDQREKLLSLHKEVLLKSSQIREEAAKTKGVFFEALFSNQKNEKKLTLLKRRLIKLNQRKMELMLTSMSRARKIVGKSEIDEGFIGEMKDQFFYDREM